jgi:hypothetical protein
MSIGKESLILWVVIISQVLFLLSHLATSLIPALLCLLLLTNNSLLQEVKGDSLLLLLAIFSQSS